MEERFCENCGSQLGPKAKFCSECGAKVSCAEGKDSSDSLVCQGCGHAMRIDPQDQTVAECPVCGARRLLLANRGVRIQQIKSQAHKDVELSRHEMLEKMKSLEQEYKKKQDRTEFWEQALKTLLSRRGLFVGGILAILGGVLPDKRYLFWFGIFFIFIDLLKRR